MSYTVAAIPKLANLCSYSQYPVPLAKTGASVHFSKSSLQLKPGQSETFTATFTAPAGLNSKQAPIYSGFVHVGKDLVIPYYGLAASLKSMRVIDNTDVVLGLQLPALLDTNGDPVTGSSNYSVSNPNNLTVLFRLVTGTRVVSVDVVKSTNSSKSSSLLSSLVSGVLPLVKREQGSLDHQGRSLAHEINHRNLARAVARKQEKRLLGLNLAQSSDSSEGLVQKYDYAYRNMESNPQDGKFGSTDFLTVR